MSTKNITVRMDENLKKSADKLFDELGINMTTAITMFVKQAVRDQKIPFELKINTPNNETIQALLEGEKLMNDPHTKKYSSSKELFDELEKEL